MMEGSSERAFIQSLGTGLVYGGLLLAIFLLLNLVLTSVSLGIPDSVKEFFKRYRTLIRWAFYVFLIAYAAFGFIRYIRSGEYENLIRALCVGIVSFLVRRFS
jgi:hypothetical protein